MRTFMCYFLMLILSFGLMVQEASAKRFGGGRSFGVQRAHSSLFSRHPQPTQRLRQPAKTHPWGRFLGGLLVGGLLASLFMGHGLAAGMLSWLVIGVLGFLLIGFMRRHLQPGLQSATGSMFRAENFGQRPSAFTANLANAAAPVDDYPVGFDRAEFLRAAKVTFIRLQAAYDQNNKQDLSSFTAPEVFAEIEMQINERGAVPNRTQIVDLQAELLDIAEQADSQIASVRFSGVLQENDDPQAPFEEIWHFRQVFGDTKWLVGGIQQAVAP